MRFIHLCIPFSKAVHTYSKSKHKYAAIDYVSIMKSWQIINKLDWIVAHSLSISLCAMNAYTCSLIEGDKDVYIHLDLFEAIWHVLNNFDLFGEYAACTAKQRNLNWIFFMNICIVLLVYIIHISIELLIQSNPRMFCSCRYRENQNICGSLRQNISAGWKYFITLTQFFIDWEKKTIFCCFSLQNLMNFTHEIVVQERNHQNFWWKKKINIFYGLYFWTSWPS